MVYQKQQKLGQSFKTSTSFENRNNTSKTAEDVRKKVASVSDLYSRIRIVRSQLEFLKYQVQVEKMLLEEEKKITSDYTNLIKVSTSLCFIIYSKFAYTSR